MVVRIEISGKLEVEGLGHIVFSDADSFEIAEAFITYIKKQLLTEKKNEENVELRPTVTNALPKKRGRKSKEEKAMQRIEELILAESGKQVEVSEFVYRYGVDENLFYKVLSHLIRERKVRQIDKNNIVVM